MINTEVSSLIAALSEEEKEWMAYFVAYMRKNHPDIEEVISYQMPTYKLGSGKTRNYIAFSTAKNHFSMHTMDFDYILILQEKLTKPGNGKGCVRVNYTNIEERGVLINGIEDIIVRDRDRRNGTLSFDASK